MSYATHTTRPPALVLTAAVLVAGLGAATPGAQGGRGRGMGPGMMGEPAHRAHAEAVSAFLANRRAEAMKSHPGPEAYR